MPTITQLGSNQDSNAGRRSPFQGAKVGSCLTLRNELSEETPVLIKQETSLEGGAQVESSGVRGAQENCSATWLTVPGFRGTGLFSGLSLASHLVRPIV